MGFLAIVNAYTMRICLNVAITEMVYKNSSGDDPHGSCPVDEGMGGGNMGKGTFVWDEKLQGIILGSFFWVKFKKFVKFSLILINFLFFFRDM